MYSAYLLQALPAVTQQHKLADLLVGTSHVRSQRMLSFWVVSHIRVSYVQLEVHVYCTCPACRGIGVKCCSVYFFGKKHNIRDLLRIHVHIIQVNGSLPRVVIVANMPLVNL